MAIGVGGAAGAIARALVAGGVERWIASRRQDSVLAASGESLAAAVSFDPTGYRWTGTLAVNLIGCLLMGMLWRGLDHPGLPSWLRTDWARAGLLTGALGAFTTFSTFGIDLLHLFGERRVGLAAAYAGLSVALGVILVRVGHDVAGLVAGTR